MANLQWDILQSDEDFQKAKELSKEKVVVIFKHSTRCPVSSMAKRMFESQYDYEQNDVQAFFLDLIAHRSISNLISQDLAIDHQSPQMIVLKNGMAVYDSSHSMISAPAISKWL
ncbi:MAG: bacillithiol system protein YtxJ [Flavobacteriales bacterium]|jgi:bacillithiol system protein YtxJ